MIKIIFVALFSAASAGVIHDHYGHGGLVVGALPAVHAAPVAVKAHVATSYANSNSISLNPHAVAVAPAPAVLHAAPAVVHAAPVVLGHAGYAGPHGFYGHH